MSDGTDRKHSTLAIDILSNKWTPHILYMLRGGAMRHSQIKRGLPRVTQKVLTETLRKLERHGAVRRTLYPAIPPHVEYDLTELGAGLLNLSEVMTQWAEQHTEKIIRAQKAYDRRKTSATPLLK